MLLNVDNESTVKFCVISTLARATFILPVPCASNCKLAFDCVVVIRLAVTIISALSNLSASMLPIISAAPVSIVPLTVRSCCINTDDVGNTTCPNPAALNSKSAFDEVVVIDPCDTVIVSNSASTVAEMFPVRFAPLEMPRSPV